ncbi:xylulokinase [Actinomadura gamaensis]|uniref:Xylulose kinase n=1 Tax=Actinomadura gamaensis TaxID=1763541 RepID=A0ABV9TUQ5_9ACTN
MSVLVAGVDSSTQSCKVVVRDAETGRLVRHGEAPHPPGTEIDPEHWWTALQTAIGRAGGLHDVAALSVAGQQHGMVCLDASGRVVRPALLWNDTRSARAAEDLLAELGDGDRDAGARRWADAVGSVPVASFTVTKLRWLADHEPDAAARVAAVALPHDWLTWRLAGATGLDALVTDRSDASGTGYLQASTGEYRRDLLALALRDEARAESLRLPRVLAPAERAGTSPSGLVLGPGCGDNAGAALGLGLRTGQVFLSLGTSGVVAAVADRPTADPSGLVAGFADATGRHLPLACTLNAARVLDAAARLLGVGPDELSALAMRAEPGAGGLVHVPYLEGERTPNLPGATGSLHGMTLASLTRENLARAAVEGLLCLMAEATRTVRDQGIAVERITLVGGAARSEAVRRVAPALLGVPVEVPTPGEYVADGAARQAAWVLSGASEPPAWDIGESRTYTAPPTPEVLAAYRKAARHAAASV